MNLGPGSPFDVYTSTSNPGIALGTVGVTNDGRRFRFISAGAVALVPGKLQQAPAEVTANQNLAIAAAAIGATSIVTTSTVTVTANQYAGGWAVPTATPGQGYYYRILSHPATTAAVLTLTLDDAISVALTTATTLDLVANPYGSIIVNPTTATSAPVGAAVSIVPISGFGWVQTEGVTSVLADGTVTVGTALVASNGTAGAAEALAGVQAPVATALTGIATTEYGAVNLQIN